MKINYIRQKNRRILSLFLLLAYAFAMQSVKAMRSEKANEIIEVTSIMQTKTTAEEMSSIAAEIEQKKALLDDENHGISIFKEDNDESVSQQPQPFELMIVHSHTSGIDDSSEKTVNVTRVTFSTSPFEDNEDVSKQTGKIQAWEGSYSSPAFIFSIGGKSFYYKLHMLKGWKLYVPEFFRVNSIQKGFFFGQGHSAPKDYSTLFEINNENGKIIDSWCVKSTDLGFINSKSKYCVLFSILSTDNLKNAWPYLKLHKTNILLLLFVVAMCCLYKYEKQMHNFFVRHGFLK